MTLAMPAMAQNACSKANCKITLQTGDGSPFLKGCGEGADIGRIEYVLSSPNGQSSLNDFQSTGLLQTQSAQSGYRQVVSGKLEYRSPNTGNAWQDLFQTNVLYTATGAELGVPVVWEFRAKAGAVIGNSKGTGRARTTMEILKIGGPGPTNITIESGHQVLFFLGGEGCGQWGFGHGHVYDPDTGERVR